MKREVFISLIYITAFLQGGNVLAQDLEYTQYYLNLPGFNPGFTGIENFWDLKMGFQQGANNFSTPNRSLYVSSYGVVNAGVNSSRNNNSLRTSDQNSYNKIGSDKDTRKKLFRKHGVGGMLYNRAMNTYQSFNASMNYAYHLPITQTKTLTLGTTIRYTNQQIGFENLTVRDDVHDLYYQQLVRSGKGRMDMVVVDFGSALYSGKFYLGISSSGLINQALGTSDFNAYSLRSYSLQTSRFVSLTSALELSPMVKLDYSAVNGFSGTVTGRVRYKNLAYAGLGYKSNGKLSGLLGFTVDGKYNFNYSYDHYLASLGNFNVSVHEIVFGLSLFNKYRLSSTLW
jgi:type IX secretion system PorP/SprF family membrane protein